MAVDRGEDAMTVSASENQFETGNGKENSVAATCLHLVGQDMQWAEEIRSVSTSLGVSLRTHRSAEDCLQCLDDACPACLIAELQLPGMDVLALLKALKERNSFVPLIVLTQSADVRTAVAVIRAGALTLLEKPFQQSELEQSICQAMVAEQRYRRFSSHKRDLLDRLAELTEQEKSVLQLMVDGLPNKSIACRLDVSLRTVEGRRREVFNKLQANSLAEAVRLVTTAEMPVCVCVCHPQESQQAESL